MADYDPTKPDVNGPPPPGQNLETTSILNAILVPERCRGALYPSVTPVNTFRVILDGCIETSLGVVDESTYWGEDEYFRVAPAEPR